MLRIQIPLATFLIAALVPQLPQLPQQGVVVTQQDAVPQQSVKSLMSSPTQMQQKSSATSESPPRSRLPSPQEEERIRAEVAEIMAIRKQLGGGISETLGDLSLEMPGAKPGLGESATKAPLNYESEFAAFLAQRSRSTGPPTQRSSGPPTQRSSGSSTQLSSGSSVIQYPESETLPQAEKSLPGQPLTMDQLERQESIRNAARMLEEAAATLEEASVYDRADQIRQTSAELWRTAR